MSVEQITAAVIEAAATAAALNDAQIALAQSQTALDVIEKADQAIADGRASEDAKQAAVNDLINKLGKRAAQKPRQLLALQAELSAAQKTLALACRANAQAMVAAADVKAKQATHDALAIKLGVQRGGLDDLLDAEFGHRWKGRE